MISSIARNRIVHATCLVVLCFTCYHQIFKGYFLADDFWHVSYATRILAGDYKLFWANFTGNFGGIPGLDFYRPLLAVTFLTDFILWKTGACGYYFTNLLFYAGDVLLVYWLAVFLVRRQANCTGAIPALVSATLFAVYPLHAESVCWISGRSDLVSAFFYLLALIIFLKSEQSPGRMLKTAGLVSFWFALFSKESSIGLPIVLVAIACLIPHSSRQNHARSFHELFRRSLIATFPYWLSAFLYLGIRYAALGTFFGGYTGVLGSAFNQWILQRWFDPNTVYRFFFPFSREYFFQPFNLAGLLQAGYLAAAATALLRLIWSNRKTSARLIVFFLIWSFSVIFPLVKVWGIGPNLEGSRLFFFLSIPLCIGLSFMLTSPVNRDSKDVESPVRGILFLVSGLVFLLIIGCVWAYSTRSLVVTWRDAGRQVRQVADGCRNLAESLPEPNQFIVLGLPKMHGGAYMILNGAIFRAMLSPPFSSHSIAQRFLTFEPYLLGPGETINSSRLKELLHVSTVKGPYVWNGDSRRFEPVSLVESLQAFPDAMNTGFAMGPNAEEYFWIPVGSAGAEIKDGSLILRNVRYGDGIKLSGLNLNPLAIDVLKFDISLAHPGRAHLIRTRWKGNPGASKGIAGKDEIGVAFRPPTADFYTACVDLSHNWRWFTSGNIEEVFIDLFPAEKIEIRKPIFLSAVDLKPKLSLSGLNVGNNGAYLVSRLPAELKVDGRMVPGTAQLEIEITRPNFFFDNFLVLKESSIVSCRQYIDAQEGSCNLGPQLFPEDAYYEVRALCRSGQGQLLGRPSDPITLFCKLENR